MTIHHHDHRGVFLQSERIHQHICTKMKVSANSKNATGAAKPKYPKGTTVSKEFIADDVSAIIILVHHVYLSLNPLHALNPLHMHALRFRGDAVNFLGR